MPFYLNKSYTGIHCEDNFPVQPVNSKLVIWIENIEGDQSSLEKELWEYNVSMYFVVSSSKVIPRGVAGSVCMLYLVLIFSIHALYSPSTTKPISLSASYILPISISRPEFVYSIFIVSYANNLFHSATNERRCKPFRQHRFLLIINHFFQNNFLCLLSNAIIIFFSVCAIELFK